MTIFLDTANLEHIKKYLEWGIKGVTTNQKIFLKEKGVDFEVHNKKILKLVEPYPVSIELTKTNRSDKDLIHEARTYSNWGLNVVVKVPMWGDGRGIRIAKILDEEGIKINITCCISLNQAILACELGVDFVSLFYNRMVDYVKTELGDINAHIKVQKALRSLREIIEVQGYRTKIIAGSIRKPEDVTACFKSGVDIVTIPPKILEKLPFHPKTEETIKEFDDSWKEFKGEVI